MSKGISSNRYAMKIKIKNIIHHLNSERLLLIIHVKSLRVFQNKIWGLQLFAG